MSEKGYTVRYSGSTTPREFPYRCPECDHRFILMHTSRECDEKHCCPECGAEANHDHKAATIMLDADFHFGSKSFNIGWDK